jgi:hypothetical protein
MANLTADARESQASSAADGAARQKMVPISKPALIESPVDGALCNCYDSAMPRISITDAPGNSVR